MIIVSSREFRDKQASYFDRVDNGEEVLVQRGKDKSYKIVAVSEDDTLISKEEFFAKIDFSLQQAKDGKVKKVKSKKELMEYLNNL